MFYESELFFAQQLLKRHHIPATIINTESLEETQLDTGFGRLLGIDKSGKSFRDFFPELETHTIYKVRDMFFCHYIYLLLPDTETEKVLFIGPYVKGKVAPQTILERGEKLGLDPRSIKQFEFYLGNVSTVLDEQYIFTLLDTLGEFMWGDDNFTVTDINREDSADPKISTIKNETSPEDTVLKMHIMEKRYNFENELMDAVAHGKMNKAEIMLANFSELSFERRLTDQLRNIKNYCIIMNTLLRKAAENGGVHPIYIDSLSSEYAKKIEALPTVSAAGEFMLDIFGSYCMLVRRKSMRHYSPIIQRAVACVDSDLTADLTLKRLANMNNVSASYFSTLFKKETGQTLTEYVNGKRMAQAKNLLKNTNLQIQTVAQHCGILDVHYFSKLFKKSVGKTPKEYRETAI